MLKKIRIPERQIPRRVPYSSTISHLRRTILLRIIPLFLAFAGTSFSCITNFATGIHTKHTRRRISRCNNNTRRWANSYRKKEKRKRPSYSREGPQIRKEISACFSFGKKWTHGIHVEDGITFTTKEKEDQI